jgi:hypothetical protein
MMSGSEDALPAATSTYLWWCGVAVVLWPVGPKLQKDGDGDADTSSDFQCTKT